MSDRDVTRAEIDGWQRYTWTYVDAELDTDSYRDDVAEGIRCGACKSRHATIPEARDCHVEFYDEWAENRGEVYAEAVMSWVTSGGNPEDASTYASGVVNGRY